MAERVDLPSSFRHDTELLKKQAMTCKHSAEIKSGVFVLTDIIKTVGVPRVVWSIMSTNDGFASSCIHHPADSYQIRGASYDRDTSYAEALTPVNEFELAGSNELLREGLVGKEGEETTKNP